MCVAYRHKRSRKGWGMWPSGKVLVEQTRDPRLSGQVGEKGQTPLPRRLGTETSDSRGKTLVRPKHRSSARCQVLFKLLEQ